MEIGSPADKSLDTVLPIKVFDSLTGIYWVSNILPDRDSIDSLSPFDMSFAAMTDFPNFWKTYSAKNF